MDGQAALWAAILASGVYHGLNPGMGWPLAVAAGLTERRGTAVARTLVPLAAVTSCRYRGAAAVRRINGTARLELRDPHRGWARDCRLLGSAASLSTPSALAGTLAPTQVMLWSFSVALLHGAGLMLVPMLLGLCVPPSSLASGLLASSLAVNAGLALGVALAHTAALMAGSGLLAWAIYRALGLEMLNRSWFDLRRVWAGSLAFVGALAVWTAV